MPQAWRKHPHCWSQYVQHHHASEHHCRHPQQAAVPLHVLTYVYSAAACGIAASQRTAHTHNKLLSSAEKLGKPTS